MKRNPLLICILMVLAFYITGNVQAQPLVTLKKETGIKAYELPRNATHSQSKTTVSNWFNPRDEILASGLFPNITRSLLTLFPDSTVLINYRTSQMADSLGSPQYHSAGTIIDPRSIVYDLKNFNEYNAYTVDSIELPYLYKRFNSDITIVDTLLLQFYDNTGIQNLALGITTPSNAVGTVGYNPTTNRGVNSKMDIKIPLTVLDSAWGRETAPGSGNIALGNLQYAVGLSVAKNNRVAVTMTFIPGYNYSLVAPYDTLQADYDSAVTVVNRLNQFTFLRFAYGELFSETPGTLNPATKRIYLNGLFVSTSIRGNNEPPNGWNGKYYPGIYSFGGGPFITTFTELGLLLTADNVGIDKINASGYAMGDAFPNPVSTGEATLDFNIANSQAVTLTVSNVLGQTIKTATDNFTAGAHRLLINTADLETGVYFYTLSSGSFSQTKKLTVTK